MAMPLGTSFGDLPASQWLPSSSSKCRMVLALRCQSNNHPVWRQKVQCACFCLSKHGDLTDNAFLDVQAQSNSSAVMPPWDCLYLPVRSKPLETHGDSAALNSLPAGGTRLLLNAFNIYIIELSMCPSQCNSELLNVQPSAGTILISQQLLFTK